MSAVTPAVCAHAVAAGFKNSLVSPLSVQRFRVFLRVEELPWAEVVQPDVNRPECMKQHVGLFEARVTVSLSPPVIRASFIVCTGFWRENS